MALDTPLLLSLLAGTSVALFVIGIFRGNRVRPQSRIQRRVGELAMSEVEPLDRSFAERIMQPLMGGLLRVATSIMPTRIVASVNEKIEVAGRPTTVSRFLTMWVVVGVCLPIAFALLVIFITGSIGGAQLLIMLVWMGAGLYLPWTSLRRKANQRAKEIGRTLPDAIDLIITNIEAGLGMQAAMLTVAEKFHGPIAEEFGRVVREISVGGERTEVLVAMAERTGVPDMRLFARAVAQAEQTGIPVARVLRNHAVEVRTKRQQLAREQAAKIPVKIIFPTVMVMFPTLFMVILGPVVLNILEQFESR